MIRCDASASDGRRCCRPMHGTDKKHLLVAGSPNREQLLAVAQAWGFPAKAAASAVDGAMSAGQIGVDKFIKMVQTFADALLDESDKRA